MQLGLKRGGGRQLIASHETVIWAIKQNPVLDQLLHLPLLQLRKVSPQREMAALQSHTGRSWRGWGDCNTHHQCLTQKSLEKVPKKNSDSKGWLGSTGVFQGLYTVTETVCRTVCGFAVWESRVYCFHQSEQGPWLKKFKNYYVKNRLEGKAKSEWD